MGSSKFLGRPPPTSSFTLSTVSALKWYRVRPIDSMTGDYAPDTAACDGSATHISITSPGSNAGFSHFRSAGAPAMFRFFAYPRGLAITRASPTR
ncbi:hypothetical protein R69776_04654 [Paraburkholderia nemoris]|uniref:Uncharacterized protein n=1 Tax=Paraburkholderia nemoris TaxID=2793076 RepID=A0ABM8S4J9_9BURK|nr:hypothetical protein R20943_03146 [Paraburkholderia aspalathi]CAE6788737.1 hypothetical protein R69776_04654 [Paraburkholderia nemoris]